MTKPVIGDIGPDHYKDVLRLNQTFVHWTAPMDAAALKFILSHADYARQIDSAAGVLIGYAHDTAYPDHKNLIWLRERLCNFFYIDRVIVDPAAHGSGLGRMLYEDVAKYARACGHSQLACEVNTVPDNPRSHQFHLRSGFAPIGERHFSDSGKSVRYYALEL